MRTTLEMVKPLHTSSNDMTCQNAKGNTPLHVACTYRRHDIIEYFLDFPQCGANITNLQGNFPLHLALLSSNFFARKLMVSQHIVKLILRQFPEAGMTSNHNGDVPLHMICKGGNVDELEELMEDICLDFTDTVGNTLLHIACIHRKEKVIKWLAEQGANCSIQNTKGELPHHLLFSSHGKEKNSDIDVPIKEMLMVLGVSNIMHIQNKFGDTILHLACREGMVNVLVYLLNSLKCDTTLTIQNSEGDTPLHIAAAVMQTHLKLKTIKDYALNTQNNQGNTPLHIACQSQNIKFASMLLRLNCSPDIFNHKKDLPIHIAASQSMSMVKLVTCSLKYINSRNAAGETPLHIACRAAKLDTVYYLIKELKCPIIDYNSFFCLLHERPLDFDGKENIMSPVDPTICTEEGDNLLHIACRTEFKDASAVSFLITYLKSCINVQNKFGATPLHYACITGMLAVVKLVSDCNPKHQVTNDKNFKKIKPGDTPLHIACRAGRRKIVQFLLSTAHKEALSIRNEYGELPLHVACTSNINVVKDIISSLKEFDCNYTNLKKETFLHIACSYRKNVIVSFLVNEMQCRCDVPNRNGDLPLHIACKMLNGEAVKILVKAMNHHHLSWQNEANNTALHLYFGKLWTKRLGVGAIKLLVQEIGDSVSVIYNSNGELPIHLACRNTQLNAVRCLKSHIHINSLAVTKEGNTLFHEACLNENPNVLKFVVENSNHDANIVNNDGDLPLHIACHLKHVKNVRCLLDKTADVNVRNNVGNSPLDVLYDPDSDNYYKIEYYRSDILEILLQKNVDFCTQNANKMTLLHHVCKYGSFKDLKTVLKSVPSILNASIPNNDGNSALHLACQRNDLELVKLLLTSTKVDLSLMNKKSQTPIMMASSEITKYLITQGADTQPLYETYRSFFQKYSLENPPPTPVKVLVVGHPSVGKTSLTLSLRSNEDNSIAPVLTYHPTAGVVPIDFTSKIYGTIIMYDFAGQPEYYVSHDAVIHNTMKDTPPIVLLVVKLTNQIQMILDQIQFWSDFISNKCSLLTDRAHVIIVGSHADVTRNPSHVMDKVLSKCNHVFQSSQVALKGSIYMNCTQPHSTQLYEIQQLLSQCTNEIRKEEVMHLISHCFYILLFQLFKDTHITLGQVLSRIKHSAKSDENPIKLLPSDCHTVMKMCEELDEMGHIMFIKHPSIMKLSWLILKKDLLLQDMLGSLFAPIDLQEHFLSCSTGVVPISSLRERFGERGNTNMLITFLTKMEYCRELRDTTLLRYIMEKELLTNTERYFFFPSLVSLKRPNDGWADYSNLSYKCGWFLQCSREGELFNARFIQVFLLRVTFAFALKQQQYDSRDIETYADDLREETSPIMNLVLKRNCILWENGIHWLEQSGIDIIIDIIGQRTLLLLMQCPQGSEVQLIERRSQIMSMVLEAKQEICPKAKLLECFLQPSSIKHPIQTFDSSVMFSLPSINDSIANRQPYVIEHCKQIKLDQLLYFEPYAEISNDTVVQLVDEANSHQQATDEIFFSLAHQLCHRYAFFLYLCHPTDVRTTRMTSLASHGPERDNTHKLACLLMQIKQTPSGGTFHELRKLLDQLSIYCGRQPPQGRYGIIIMMLYYNKMPFFHSVLYFYCS